MRLFNYVLITKRNCKKIHVCSILYKASRQQSCDFSVCLCLCVCVRERTERESGRKKDRERESTYSQNKAKDLNKGNQSVGPIPVTAPKLSLNKTII